jgi:hypothetical protein
VLTIGRLEEAKRTRPERNLRWYESTEAREVAFALAVSELEAERRELLESDERQIPCIGRLKFLRACEDAVRELRRKKEGKSTWLLELDRVEVTMGRQEGTGSTWEDLSTQQRLQVLVDHRTACGFVQARHALFRYIWPCVQPWDVSAEGTYIGDPFVYAARIGVATVD